MESRRYAIGLAAMVVLLAGAVALAQPATAPAPKGEDAPADVEPPEAPQPKAQETGPAAAQSSGTAQAPAAGRRTGLGDQWFLFVVLGGFLLLWFWMGRGRKKEQRKRKDMLEALKKGDKITSIGGICGTVVDVKDDEVVVKVDESANVRMKLARWAIRGIGDTAKAERPEQADHK